MKDSGTLIPRLDGNLRAHNVQLPKAAQDASGIRILGKLIKSIVYSTDIAIIRNCDADAVFAVYPFTPQQMISKAIIEAASMPVFVGVGGGTTNGTRSAVLAHDAEADGAHAVVLNAPANYTTLEMVSRIVDIPVIVTVVNSDPIVIANRIASGASIVNVSGGKNTPQYVAEIREKFPELPIIATGGKTDESIEETVRAGANAVICTPPSNRDLFSPMMGNYRESVEVKNTPAATRPFSDASRKEMEERLAEIRSLGFLI